MNELLIIIFLIIIIFLLYWFGSFQQETGAFKSPSGIIVVDNMDVNISNKEYRNSFKTEIEKAMEKANSTHNKSSIIYKSYAKANLYFLKPFISKKEYSDLSFRIGNTWTPDTPRYIEPDLLLNRSD